MSSDETSSPTNVPLRKKRRLRRILLVVGGIVLVLAGLLVVAPRYVGRLILAHYVEGLGIDVEGTRTLDIELWRGRISFGPARFSLGEADPGQVTRMALQFSLPPVFQRRALLTTLVIEGLQLRVAEDAEGKLTINGVPLKTLLPPPEEAAANKEKQEKGWGAGLDSFELRDSQVVYAIPDGGEARLVVDRLDLIGFRTWQPDNPGTFAAEGRLNDIALRMDGEAWPFAEETHVRLAFSLADVEWGKIERFTGDLHLQPKAGRLNVSGAGELKHHPDTGADFSVTGEMSVAGLDVARADMGHLAMAQASGTYSLRSRISPANEAGTAGAISFQAANGQAALPDGLAVTFDRFTVSPTDLKLEVAADDSVTLQAVPAVQVAGVALSGPAAASAATLDLALNPLDLAISPKGALALETAGTLKGTEIKATPSGGDGGATSVHSSAVTTEIGALTVKTEGDRLNLGGRLTLASPALGASLGGGPQRAPAQTIELSALKADLPHIGVDGDTHGRTIAIQGNLAADTLTLAQAGSQPAQATLNGPGIDIGDLSLRLGGDTMQLATTLTASAASVKAAQRAATGQGGGDAAALAADKVAVSLQNLGLGTRQAATTLSGAASLSLGNADLNLPAVTAQPTVRMAGLSLEAADLNGSLKPDGIQVKTRVSGQIKQPNAGWRTILPGASGKPTGSTATADSVRIEPSPLGLRLASGTLDLDGNLSVVADRLAMRSPALDAMAGGAIDLGKGQVLLREVRQGKPKPESWRVGLDANLSDLHVGGEQPIPRFKIAQLATEGFSTDDRGAIDLGDLLIGNAVVAISTAWIARLGGDPAAKEVAQTVEKTAETKPVRIGSVRVEDGATVDFTDTSMNPPAHFKLQVKTLDLGTLDTTKPQGRTDIYLRATLNEFTPIEIQGWATPMASKPDFALAVRVQELQLPSLSPYTRRAAGLNIESGSLKVDAEATANAGQLAGVVRLNVGSLAVQSASAEDAARVEQTIGLPVSAAIGLIQDDEGRIRLDIPLAGDLASPSFDFSDAIGQAVTNVLKGAVLAPFRLALLPVTMIAGAAAGGTPTLPPIPFTAGQATLDSQANAALAGLAKVLGEHGKVRVKVCGRATAADRDALTATDPSAAEEALRGLAAGRTLAVRRALIENYGVAGDQVLDCRATYSATDTGQPRVDIEF